MSDLPFGLQSRSTFAALSPADLQSLAKRASVAYLSGGISLNDAIIKLAREYPSISPHQVQRVVEFANQETFAKLFSDNEKYASDKNIEFDVADPAVVLREMNEGARPAVMSVPPDEYSSSPVKLAHSAVEADIALSHVFGVDPALPGSESTIYAQVKVAEDGTRTIERVLSTFPKEAEESNPIDRILSTGKAKHANLVSGIAAQPAATAAPAQAQAPAPMQGQVGSHLGSEDDGATHNEQMLGLQREIELAKKRQELQKVEQQTIDQMAPDMPPGSVPAPVPGGGPAGPAAAAGGGGAPQEAAPDAGAAAGPEAAAGPVESAPPQEMQIPPELAGAMAAPPGSEGMKTSMVKQAMDYVKSGRPHADLLLEAARSAVSIDMIKKATAGRGEYPMANPYGAVIRSKQKIAKLLEDCSYARGKNLELHKEASARFEKTLAQHLYSGGSMGEVAHLMSAVGSPEQAKEVLAAAMPHLVRHGLDPVKARASIIQYEMEKGASARTPNLNHPIAEAYSDILKLADGTTVLEEAWSQLSKQYRLVDKALQEAAAHAPSL